MRTVDVTIHYLELVQPADFRPKRSGRAGVRFAMVPVPMPELNRFFYCAVGAAWTWYERRSWTLAQWAAAMGPELETWVLSVDGIPAGYTELKQLDDGAVELNYFGLLAPYVGAGFGAHLLTEAVDRAWAMGATRVVLNTCSLDHPAALGNYLARGFTEIRAETIRKQLPADPPGPWNSAVESR
jgi:GNAT superfamily N-acetyltransferase